MSDLEHCPYCGHDRMTHGYGYAAGPLGAYSYCDGCNELVDFWPDTEGLSEADEASAIDKAEKWKAAEPERVAARKAKP